jgi:hypothetical protein
MTGRLFWVSTLLAAALPVGADQQDLVIRARLTDKGAHPVDCGIFHFATVMKYKVVAVEQGTYREPVLFATHGCSELPREQYGKDAGTLQSFKVGDIHRLVLTRVVPDGVMVNDGLKKVHGVRYWVVRADLVNAGP